jgi:phosphohistidine swiveling domain-containing protein
MTKLNHEKQEVSSGNSLKVFKYNESTNQFCFTEEKAVITMVGAKALNLAFLENLGYVAVPAFSAVSSQVFKMVVNQNPELKQMREHLCQEMESYSSKQDKVQHEMKVFQIAAKLREYVQNMQLPLDLVENSKQIYHHVSENGSKAIAVRSSAKAEDLPGASFAGLYDSYLNIRDFDAFLEAMKKCWASSFNDRAVQYYMYKGIALREIYMSSVVMQLVDGAISGTVFTTDITNGYDGIHVMASNGLEAVVGGDISADSYLFHSKHFTALKRIRGSKEFMYIPNENGSGMQKVALGSESDKYCLTINKARELAKLVSKISLDYQAISQGPVDTEYVIDKEGNIFIVQIRPVVNVTATEVDDIDFKALSVKPKIVATGKHAVFGVKCGRIKIIEDFHSLERGDIKIDPTDIVVSTRTENEWTQYLTMFSGIITTEGNPTSHPVLISREKNVPCLVGVANAINRFKDFDGQWVTLDGFRKCVYLGKLPLKRVNLNEVKDVFAVLEEEKLQPEEEMLKDLVAKGFMREEDGKKWITGINANFSGALLHMVENAYNLREKAINDSGISDPVSLKTKQKIFFINAEKETGKVYDHWWAPHEEQLKICMRMELDHFLAFYKHKGDLMLQLVQQAKDFDLSISSWRKMRNTYEEVTAYQLLGFLERYPLIHKIYQWAKEAEIPRFFYEEYAASVPDFEFEEDVAFLNDTKKLALELKSKNWDLDQLTLNDIQVADPKFYAKIVFFSRQYKFSKDEDWLSPPPVDKALAKIIGQVKSGDFDLIHKEDASTSDIEYFSDQLQLREGIRLSIVKKLQQNDIHHVRSRAQWYLRDKIMLLGEFMTQKKLLENPEKLLVMNINELEKNIEKYGVEANLSQQRSAGKQFENKELQKHKDDRIEQQNLSPGKTTTMQCGDPLQRTDCVGRSMIESLPTGVSNEREVVNVNSGSTNANFGPRVTYTL